MSVRHGEHDLFDVTQAPPPDYVVTEDDRARWVLAGLLAAGLWEKFAPDEPLDSGWYMLTQRSLYASDMPTGAPSDEVWAMVVEALETRQGQPSADEA